MQALNECMYLLPWTKTIRSSAAVEAKAEPFVSASAKKTRACWNVRR
jgi:hypothetical protein